MATLDCPDAITSAEAALPTTPSVLEPNPPHNPGPSTTTGNRGPPPLLAPQVNLENLRAAECRARQEIELIEHAARTGARSIHPLTPLPRDESNKLSVKRTRRWRKEVDDIIIAGIKRKVTRNRELDRQIEELEEQYRQIHLQVEEAEKPAAEPNPDQADADTSGHTVEDLITEIQAKTDSPSQELGVDHFLPDVDFD